MSVNFPFIFLGIVELSPLQVLLLTGASVFAQCRIHVVRTFTLVQIIFNVANAVAAAALADFAFRSLERALVTGALSLTSASVVYFFANTVPVALAIAWTKQESACAVWRRQYPWYLPFYFFGAVLMLFAKVITDQQGWLTSTWIIVVPSVFIIYRVYHTQSTAIRERQQHLEETEALHLRTIEALAIAVEAKDQNTHQHLSRVRVYVSEIGKSLALDEIQMKALVTAAYLHDVGKLAIPEQILNKPGKLTRDEFEKMKTHTVVGAEILERVRFPYPVVPIVRAHHECWDGSGYPDGLAGEQIPIGARILSVVDCFDALVSDRPYRRAMSLEEAIALVRRECGIRFDPAIVSILDCRYQELEALARASDNGMQPLNTNVRVVNGAAPAAGFAEETPPVREPVVVPIARFRATAVGAL
jgi:putative nucleotidyltransferase with HDIG domain